MVLRRTDSKEFGQRINEMIRVPQVRVIGEEGEQVGVMSVQDALSRARKVNLDLVEVAPDANPPVCKIIDYGKFRYEMKKKTVKKQNTAPALKELRLRPKTGEHDVLVKLNKAREFLAKKDKILVSIQFKGREMAYIADGEKLMDQFIARLEDVAKVETPSKQMGRRIICTLGPK